MACPLLDTVLANYKLPLVMAGGLVSELLTDRRSAAEFVPGAKIRSVRPVLRAAKRIRGLGICAGFLVNRSFRSALALRLAGVPERIGHTTEGRGFLLTKRVRYDPVKFESDCYLDLARACSLEPADIKPKLTVENAERAGGLALVEGANVGFQPGARYSKKQIPVERLAAVAKELARRGHRIATFGGAEESADASRFESIVGGGVVNLVGRCGIRETLAAMSALRAMVGSDTGLMHAAAAVGVPTITVFGPNPASKWGHDYHPHRVLVAPGRDVRKFEAERVLAAVEQVLGPGA